MTAFIRFVLIGGFGFLVDAGLTLLLVSAGLLPWQARIPALLCAMGCTWIANRRFTYRASGSRPLVEASRYALVAFVMAGINYLLFVSLVSVGVPTLVAIIASTACQTLVSFWAYRHFVFGGLA